MVEIRVVGNLIFLSWFCHTVANSYISGHRHQEETIASRCSQHLYEAQHQMNLEMQPRLDYLIEHIINCVLKRDFINCDTVEQIHERILLTFFKTTEWLKTQFHILIYSHESSQSLTNLW